MMRVRCLAWVLIGIASIVACGGKIAPTDTFGDDPSASSTSGTSGTSGGTSGRPTPVPPNPPNMKPPFPTKPPPPPLLDGGVPDPPPDDSFKWMPLDFRTSETAYSDCAGGKKYVRPSKRYNAWVGVELCDSTRYKIYLAGTRKDIFRDITDGSGHGQDHCELVNPKFDLPDEDDITSGGCTACDIDDSLFEAPGSGTIVFDRAYFGAEFFSDEWPSGYYTAAWYECGVAIP